MSDSDENRVLLAHVLEVDGLLHLQVVAVGRLDGALLTSRGAVAGVSLPGLTSGATVVVLRATQPFGFVTGVVQTAAGVARPGVVVTSAAGFVDVSRADGRYVLATTAGSVTVTADDAATGQGASQPVTVTAGAATPQPLTVATIPPRVVRITPAAGATGVPVQTQVEVTFSKPVSRTSVTSATLVLASAAGAVDTVVVLSPTGTVATLYPTRALAPQTPYTVQATTAITDAQGAALAAPVTSPFTTVDTTPPPPPAAGAIIVSFPDLQGTVTVTATQGTAEPNALVTVLNLSSGSAASATVQANGSFTATLFAFLGDELVIVIKDAAGNQTVVSPGPYRSATGEFVVTAQGGTVEGAGGVRVTVPAGALVGPATIKVSPLAQADLPGAVPTGETFAGGVRIASDQRFATDVTVTLPIPTGTTIDPKARPYLARYELIDGVQTPVMIDSLRVVNGTLTTSSPPFLGVLAAGDYFALVPTLPFPALVSGVVSQRQADGSVTPVAGAVIRSGLRTARSGPDGRWALFVFPATLAPETFVFTASDPTTGVAQSKTVRVGAWVTTGVDVAGGIYTLNFALDPAPPTADQTPPQVVIGVTAPSLQAGRVTVGDLVTVTLRVTDDRGLRPDSVTLLVNSAPVPVTNTGTGTDFTASFAASAVNTIYHLVVTARDASLNKGQAEARLLAISGAPPPSRPGIPFVLTTGITPPDGAIDVNVFTELEVPFSEGITNLNATTVVLQEAVGGATVPADLLLSGATASDRVIVRPRGNLKFGTTYRLTLAAGLKDQDNELLGQDVTTRFTTKALTKEATVAGNFREVVQVDQTLFVIDRNDGLQVIDVSIPTEPRPLLVAPVKPFFVLAQPSAYQGLAVVRDFVYEVPGQGLRTADLALVVGFRWMPGEGAQALLGVLDVTNVLRPPTVPDPTMPLVTRLGDTVLADRTAGLPMRVLVKGQYALVSTTSMGVLVVDLAKALAVMADPQAFPLHQRSSVVGLYDAGGALTFPIGLAHFRGGALVGDVNRGLYRLNLSALPAITGEQLLAMRVFRLEVVEAFPVTDPATGTTRVTDLALISNSDGLTIVDLGTVPPTVLRTLPVPGGAPFDVSVNRERGLVFVASGGGGLTVVDLRQPASPVVIGTRNDLGFVNGDVTFDREYAYVTGPGGLQVVQYDPCCVQILVELANGQHYAMQGQDGVLYIKSLGDPNNPGDPQDPLRFEMPQLRLRARLVNPNGTALLRRQERWIRWDVTLRYRVTVQAWPKEGRFARIRSEAAQRRTHDDTLTWTSRPVRLPGYWSPSQQTEPVSEWIDIPWSALQGEQRNPANPATSRVEFTPAQPFVGGGILEIAATVLDGPNLTTGTEPTHSNPRDGLTKIGGQGSGENIGAYKLFIPSMSPDTSGLNLNGLRIEGQLASAISGRPAYKVDGGLLGRIVRYLKRPTGIPTTPPRSVDIPTLATTIRDAVTSSATPGDVRVRDNLFRLIAYKEAGPWLRHFVDLVPWGRTAERATVPKEAVWPSLNVSGEAARAPAPGAPPEDRQHTDGGYGLMQLTELDDPTAFRGSRSPTYGEAWDFRQNIDAAIELLGRKFQRVNADVQRYPGECIGLGADADSVTPLSVEDKRMTLYNKYHGADAKVRKPNGEIEDNRYLAARVDDEYRDCRPARRDSAYTEKMKEYEGHLRAGPPPYSGLPGWGPE